MENAEITIANANWYNRSEAIEAFNWYGNLTNAERQAYVDTTTYEDADLLSKMMYAITIFNQITGNEDIPMGLVLDLTERMMLRSLRQNW